MEFKNSLFSVRQHFITHNHTHCDCHVLARVTHKHTHLALPYMSISQSKLGNGTIRIKRLTDTGLGETIVRTLRQSRKPKKINTLEK